MNIPLDLEERLEKLLEDQNKTLVAWLTERVEEHEEREAVLEKRRIARAESDRRHKLLRDGKIMLEDLDDLEKFPRF